MADPLPPDWPMPLWIAHRGAGKLAPENTLAAFRLGAAHGYRAFECDVKLSADGVPYLLHDATLDRTTSGRGPVTALDWAALSRLDAGGWHGPAWAGEPIASLDAIAAFCRAGGHALNIEIKPVPGTERATGAGVATAAQALWRNAPTPPLLSSFQVEALIGARDAAPDLPRALLLDQWWDGWADAADALDVVALVLHHPMGDAAVVAHQHAAGRRVLTFTANDPDRVAALMAMGIDGVITDAVDRFDPALGRDAA
jgi:glycerophosphoryl diester phosphodiesterase